MDIIRTHLGGTPRIKHESRRSRHLVFKDDVTVAISIFPCWTRDTRDGTYMAWMIPGIQPRMVKQMLMRRSAPQPRSRKTPRGGRTMAKMILQMSLEKVSLVAVDQE